MRGEDYSYYYYFKIQLISLPEGDCVYTHTHPHTHAHTRAHVCIRIDTRVEPSTYIKPTFILACINLSKFWRVLWLILQSYFGHLRLDREVRATRDVLTRSAVRARALSRELLNFWQCALLVAFVSFCLRQRETGLLFFLGNWTGVLSVQSRSVFVLLRLHQTQPLYRHYHCRCRTFLWLQPLSQWRVR